MGANHCNWLDWGPWPRPGCPWHNAKPLSLELGPGDGRLLRGTSTYIPKICGKYIYIRVKCRSDSEITCPVKVWDCVVQEATAAKVSQEKSLENKLFCIKVHIVIFRLLCFKGLNWGKRKSTNSVITHSIAIIWQIETIAMGNYSGLQQPFRRWSPWLWAEPIWEVKIVIAEQFHRLAICLQLTCILFQKLIFDEDLRRSFAPFAPPGRNLSWTRCCCHYEKQSFKKYRNFMK